MDIGEPIRELEVVPKHVPVPTKDPEKAPIPKEKEPTKNAVLNNGFVSTP